jgi:hypothetical protein
MLENFESFIKDETDKQIELYYRCSYKTENVEFPRTRCAKSSDFAPSSNVLERHKSNKSLQTFSVNILEIQHVCL